MKIEFKSNCMEFASLNYFVLPYNKDYELGADSHPRRVILSLFGKAYQFDFSEPLKEGNGNHVDIKYSKVKVTPSGIPNKVSTLIENNILLRTNESSMYVKSDIDTVFYKKNPCLCSLEKSK